jgi:hypothetical protein
MAHHLLRCLAAALSQKAVSSALKAPLVLEKYYKIPVLVFEL